MRVLNRLLLNKLKSFKPNQPTTIYIEHHTKTFYVIYPLSTVFALWFLQTLRSQPSRSQGTFYMNFSFVVTFAFLFFFFSFFSLILCACVIFFFFSIFLLPLSKFLNTMFDSRIFTLGVNAKREFFFFF